MAGLFLLRSLSHADDLPPARSAAPYPIAPPVSAADLKSLRDETSGSLKEQAGRLDAQAQQAKALEASLSALAASLGDLDKRLKALADDASARDVDAAGQGAKLKSLAEGQDTLRLQSEANAKTMRDGLADIAALREDLKQRQAKLDSLTDLLTVMKRDVDSNSEEIVEVKQGLKQAAQQAPAPSVSAGDDWWDQALEWKYLPAVAVGLSVIAVGVAASHK